jgi:hypothetical protein
VTAPNFQSQGAINAVTTGDLTLTLPITPNVDDIILASIILYAPATTGAITITPPADWNLVEGPQIVDGSFNLDARYRLYWKRATASESNPTFVRTAGGTGASTCFAGRLYIVRGCITTGDPWDEVDVAPNAGSAPYTAANGTMDAVTVLAAERLVMQFVTIADNTSPGTAPSGWTAATAVNSGTGSDAGFQTFRQDNVSSTTAAVASTVAATAQGYCFFGVSFKPPPPAAPDQGGWDESWS